MTMIERVARVFHAAQGYDQWPHPECTQCMDAARAAIAAMREPTPFMLEAVDKAADVQGYVAAAFETMEAAKSWPVMIDAVLGEGGP